MTQHTQQSIIDRITGFFVFIYILAGALVSINRHWQYEVFYYDFGIFDQAIWNVAHFRPPVIDHLEMGGKIIFADHFNPSIFLLSPIYWLTGRPEALLIAQAVAVGLSGWILYLIGKAILKHNGAALGVTISYLLFVGLQNALITDFHEVTVMTLPLMLTLWAIVSDRKKLYWLFLLITLGCKESSFLLAASIACYVAITKPTWRKDALITVLLSGFWGWASTTLIIPYFSGGRYLYTPDFPKGIGAILHAFISKPIKLHTLLISFWSFGFLPLLSPATWPMIFQDFVVRFVPNNTDLRWDLGLHYSAQLAPIMGYSTVLGVARLAKFFREKLFLPFIALLLVTNAVFLHQFKLHGPLGLSYNPAFYRHTGDFSFLDSLLTQVPKDTSVMAQNNLAPHLIHTNAVHLLRDEYATYNPEYIVVDARAGQNPTDFFGMKAPENILAALANDKNYSLFYRTDEQYIYRRILR
jgi:uncharacterized membrane protein